MKLSDRANNLKERMIEIESRYGMVDFSYSNRSPYDSRPNTLGMRGGDRMSFHQYADVYAKFLEPFLDDPPEVIVEVGILTGIGLHIWSEVFPKTRLIGLDIDLSKVDLSKFKNVPELYKFDMFVDNIQLMGEILKGDKIDIAIDDGAHVIKANLSTYKSLSPYLSDRAIYFIEDTKGIENHINHRYNYKRITVI